MTNAIDLKQFKQTPIVKKLKKSKSTEKLDELDKPAEADETSLKILDAVSTSKRGRKSKYINDEERKAARRQQQKEYRLRKKQELEKLKEMVKDKQE